LAKHCLSSGSVLMIDVSAGSSVCRALLKHGYSVTSLARNGQPSFQGGQEPSWSKNVRFFQCNAAARRFKLMV